MDGSSTVIARCQPQTLGFGFGFKLLKGQGEVYSKGYQ